MFRTSFILAVLITAFGLGGFALTDRGDETATNESGARGPTDKDQLTLYMLAKGRR